MKSLQFTLHETQAIKRTLDQLSQRAGWSLGFDDMLAMWSQFVIEVEAGYSLSLYEYENDLSVRSVLEDVIQNVPDSVKKKITDELSVWDGRFMTATEPTPRDPANAEIDKKPWMRRIPKSIGGDLEKDLRSRGDLA